MVSTVLVLAAMAILTAGQSKEVVETPASGPAVRLSLYGAEDVSELGVGVDIAFKLLPVPGEQVLTGDVVGDFDAFVFTLVHRIGTTDPAIPGGVYFGVGAGVAANVLAASEVALKVTAGVHTGARTYAEVGYLALDGGVFSGTLGYRF